MPIDDIFLFRPLRRGVPPLGFRSDSKERADIPADWTVWAFSDAHGADDAFGLALYRASLTDEKGHWSGDPRIALVGVGDYIDRGPDSAALVERLRRLDGEITEAGSRLVLVRGNHEQMLADIMRGSREWFGAWIDNGGEATARSFGLSAISRSMDVFAHEISEAAPYLLRWMLDTLPYARWRDILFVHAGLVPGASIADLPNDDGQLWDNQLFLPTRGLPGEPAFAKYVAEGVKRIIVGHIPLPGVIRVLHGGSTLMIDTNAPGTLYTSRHKQLPGALTLVRPDTSPLFDKVHRVTVPTVG